ncbi:hypothetical protein QP185_05625 [Sphingomonas aerolata]|uniref:carbohydrate porin n=1 Tax=Sphingomonas aerolata TaxID=185951 RepID=UPI002FE21CF0
MSSISWATSLAATRGARVLDNLEITADGDLDRLAGWRGARAHLHVLSNQGDQSMRWRGRCRASTISRSLTAA